MVIPVMDADAVDAAGDRGVQVDVLGAGAVGVVAVQRGVVLAVRVRGLPLRILLEPTDAEMGDPKLALLRVTNWAELAQSDAFQTLLEDWIAEHDRAKKKRLRFQPRKEA